MNLIIQCGNSYTCTYLLIMPNFERYLLILLYFYFLCQFNLEVLTFFIFVNYSFREYNQILGMNQDNYDIDIFLNLDSQPPDVRGLQTQRTILIAPRGRAPRKGRISNNVFKAPLRYYINIILGFEGAEFLRQQVRLISKEKNLQTFPKLVCFCQRQGIRNQISQIWSFEIPKFLQERKRLLSQQKYKQIQIWTNRMSECLNQNDWIEFIQKYWGFKVRHKDKLNKCIEQIKKISTFEY